MSGSKIEVADACAPPSSGPPPAGILHLVDQPLPSTTQSLADLLEQELQFSMFVELLDVIGLTPFLHTVSPQTVFAPVNTAFDVYSDEFWNCLTIFERLPLNNLLLYHILDVAEYTSTLIARDVVYTRLLVPLFVEEGDDGQILLGTDEPVPITQPDLLASNGVAHGIPALLIPPDFSLGFCADLATMPTPTSSTAPSPTTLLSTSSPIVTQPPLPSNESMVSTAPSPSTPLSTSLPVVTQLPLPSSESMGGDEEGYGG